MRFSSSIAVAGLMAIGAVGILNARERATGIKHVVLVSGKEYSYWAPDTLQAGVNEFHFANQGTTIHHAAVLSFGTKSLDDFLGAMKANPHAWPSFAMFVGGANAPDPGGTSIATIVLQPGNYAIVCLIPDSAGVPHMMQGMAHPFVVTGMHAADPLPAAARTIRVRDYKFDLSIAVTPGTHDFRVVNNAPQPHEVELVKLAPGKTVDDLIAWLYKPDGPPPGSALGGIAPLAPGQSGNFTATFEKGASYSFICFMPDMKDGREHWKHGMTKTFTVQ